MPPTAQKKQKKNRNLIDESSSIDEVLTALDGSFGHVVLKDASVDILSNRDVVLAATKINKFNFFFAADSGFFINDREIVLVAVQRCGLLLELASEFLRGEKEVVRAAVQDAPWALEFASEALRRDRDIVLLAVGKDGTAISFAHDSLKADREVALTAVNQEDGARLFAIDHTLRDDREVVLAAVRQCGLDLQFAAKSLQADPGVVLAAVKTGRLPPSKKSKATFARCLNGLQFASNALKKDAFLRSWAVLGAKARRNRRLREAFLAQHGERKAKLKAQVDVWLINHGCADDISAKRQKLYHV